MSIVNISRRCRSVHESFLKDFRMQPALMTFFLLDIHLKTASKTSIQNFIIDG